MKRITIIGGGASGTLLAVNLIKHSDENPIEINLVEKAGEIGCGGAFSTAQDIHLLNVPAAKMGAFTDEVEHFHKWLAENDYDYAPDDFVPRKIYGEYLREVFFDAVTSKPHNVKLNLLDDEVIDVYTEEDSALVLLESGEVLPSHKVVLAFGHFLPSNPPTENEEYTAPEKYFPALDLRATPEGEIITRENKPSNVIFTLANALKGILRESTAMPEMSA